MTKLLPRINLTIPAIIRGKSKAELPQNYRRITAKISKHLKKHAQKYLVSALILEVILFVFLASFCTYLYLAYKQKQAKRVGELKRLVFWEEQSVKFPNYPEAYYNSAVHAFRLGDREKAAEYINKSLEVNPDFEPARKLRNEVK